MTQLSLVVVLLVALVVTVLSADGVNKRDSLPDAIIKSVEEAKTFLRNRKSLNKLKRKRGFEFDEEEIFDREEMEEMEESHGRFRISHSRYRYSGRRPYPSFSRTRYPYGSYRQPIRARYRSKNPFRSNFPFNQF